VPEFDRLCFDITIAKSVFFQGGIDMSLEFSNTGVSAVAEINMLPKNPTVSKQAQSQAQASTPTQSELAPAQTPATAPTQSQSNPAPIQVRTEPIRPLPANAETDGASRLGAISEGEVNMQVREINSQLLSRNLELNYKRHEGTNQYFLTIYNRDTREVVREIPPERSLDMLARIWEMTGIFMSERG
jgi:flagellar protein FlaG